MKKLLLLFVIAFISTNFASAYYLNLLTGLRTETVDDSSAFNREIVRFSNEIKVKFVFEYVKVDSSYIDNKWMYAYSIPGFGLHDEVGCPELPFMLDAVYCERDVDFNLELIDSVSICSEIRPVRQPVPTNSTLNEAIYPSIKDYDGYFPKCNALLNEVQNIGNGNVAYISVSPIKYNIRSNHVVIARELQYTLSFLDGKMRANSNVRPPFGSDLIGEVYVPDILRWEQMKLGDILMEGDVLVVRYSVAVDDEVKVTLTNVMTGQMIDEIYCNSHEESISIKQSNYPTGTYVVNLMINGSVVNFKTIHVK